MATILEKYREKKQELQQKMEQGGISADNLWRYGELSYRISVLETCQAYCKSAPATTKREPLVQHYEMIDALIQCLAQDRGYGPDRGPNTRKERDAAKANLARVIEDSRKRFSSFAPVSEETYGQEIGRAIKVFMPVWLQLREAFVPIKEEKKGDAHQ